MDFHQIDFSPISVQNCGDRIYTDDGIDDLIDNVLQSIDEFELTSAHSADTETLIITTTTKVESESMKLFSPNPFYPGQPLPIPPSSSIQPTLQYIMHKLKGKDDDNDGQLDLRQFSEAIHELDSDADAEEIEAIFGSICLGHSACAQNRISISKFMQDISCRSTEEHVARPKKLFRAAFADRFGIHVTVK